MVAPQSHRSRQDLNRHGVALSDVSVFRYMHGSETPAPKLGVASLLGLAMGADNRRFGWSTGLGYC